MTCGPFCGQESALSLFLCLLQLERAARTKQADKPDTTLLLSVSDLRQPHTSAWSADICAALPELHLVPDLLEEFFEVHPDNLRTFSRKQRAGQVSIRSSVHLSVAGRPEGSVLAVHVYTRVVGYCAACNVRHLRLHAAHPSLAVPSAQV